MRSPWLDCYSSARSGAEERGPSLAAVLERLRERTGERAGPVLRAGAEGLLLLAEGPWLSWLPLPFLERLPALGIEPLPLPFGRRRYRTGLVARRSAEDLAPVRAVRGDRPRHRARTASVRAWPIPASKMPWFRRGKADRDVVNGVLTGRLACGDKRRRNDVTKRNSVLALLALICALMAASMAGHAMQRTDPSPAGLVEWQSVESAERLFRSSHRADFFPLSNHFISQDNKIFCGPVSSAIVLNALRLGRREGLPRDRRSITEDEMAWLPQGADPFFGKYTPNNVLNDRTKARLEVLGRPIVIDGEPKSDFGLQLRQLAQVLRSHGLDVVTRVVDESADPAAIRREIAANLATGDDFVLVNYARRALGQTGGGHISPLGAYDEGSDSFLVMDVNPNRAPWVWVRSEELIAAMRTFDTVENRGYLLVSEGE